MVATIPPFMLNKFVEDIPMHRMGQPDEIGRVVCFLAQDASGLHHRPNLGRQRRTRHVMPTLAALPLETVEVTPLHPERFAEVLPPDAFAAFQHSIARGNELLGSRTVWNVNSTAFGGGVAEMLRSLIGYVRGAGIDGRWVIAEGDDDFFVLTKRLHNRLHGALGDGGPLGNAERVAYERRCAANAAALVEMVRPGDIVILHDPQTAGMLPHSRPRSTSR